VAQGRALLYVEDAALSAPKNTLLTTGRTTYYSRTRLKRREGASRPKSG